MSKPVLAYWDIRGLGEPIRMLLHYLEVDFEDKQYDIESEQGRKVWTDEKYSLGLQFPNLPHYIDGDFKLTQSVAILRYLAEKHNLLGRTPEERAQVAMLEQQLMDFRYEMALMGFDYDRFEKRKLEYLQKLPTLVELFAKFLGDKKFAVGEHLTYVDFLFIENLILIRTLFADAYQPHAARFDAYIERVESLPTMAKYRQTRQPRPFHSTQCKWTARY